MFLLRFLEALSPLLSGLGKYGIFHGFWEGVCSLDFVKPVGIFLPNVGDVCM